MSEKKIPVVGETVIAKIAGRDKEGVTEQRTVYYGNIVMTEGKKGRFKLKAKQYDNLLEEFFASEEGKNYTKPDEDKKEPETVSEPEPEVKNEPAKNTPEENIEPASQQDENKEDTREISGELAENEEKKADVADQSSELEAAEEKMPENNNNQEIQVDQLAENSEDPIVDPDHPDELAENEPIEKAPEKVKKGIPWLIIAAVAAIMSGIFSGLSFIKSLDLNPQPEEEPVVLYEVVKVAENIPAGTVITDEMLTAETVSEADYQALFTDKQVIKSDGSTVSEKPLLWANKSQAVGTYAVDTLNTGAYLLNTSYSTLKEGENLVEMNIDGTTVRVPVEATANGSSTIRLYAIVTTSDKDGNKKTYPMDLGEFKLEGKALTDIINSEGKSVLEQLTKDSKDK